MTFDNAVNSIQSILDNTYNRGRKEENERIRSIIQHKRDSYNFQRGGKLCSNKEYLIPINHYVDVLDKILESFPEVEE